MRRCDFIAIGGGSAGLTAASRVARAGQRTALVDHGLVGWSPRRTRCASPATLGSIDVKNRVIALAASAGLTLTACEYVRLLRPSVLKQLNPRVVRLVNEFPEVDRPNEAIVARLFAHGGLSRADHGNDGVFRTRIYAPRGQYLW